MNYQDLYYFVKVVEKGSLVAASKYLGIPVSTLSRRLQAFEDDLGYKLVHRSAKKFGLTESGLRFYSSLSGLITELETRIEDVNSEMGALSGDIRITTPITLGHYFIKDWIFEFMELNPKISVEMFISNENIDLVKSSIDIAFRLGKVTLNDWVSRPLFDTGMVICAAPQLVARYGRPSDPADLDQIPLVVLKRNPFWRLNHRDGEPLTYRPAPHLQTDDIGFAVDAVLRGLGVSCVPRYVVQGAIERGELVPLLEDWSIKSRTVHVMYPHRKSVPVKTRALVDFVMEKIKNRDFSNT